MHFNARENVVRIKKMFKKEVKLYLVIKNYSNNVHKFYPEISEVDKYLKDDYTKEKLNKLLKNIL